MREREQTAAPLRRLAAFPPPSPENPRRSRWGHRLSDAWLVWRSRASIEPPQVGRRSLSAARREGVSLLAPPKLPPPPRPSPLQGEGGVSYAATPPPSPLRACRTTAPE